MKTVVYHPTIADELAGVLRDGGAPGTIVACATGEAMASEVLDADVLMATHCDVGAVVASRSLRWIQSLASGVEDWFAPPGPPAVPLTRMTGVYERYMAEYVLAHVLARTQELRRLQDAQLAREWSPFDTTSLQGKVLGVAGLGRVASELVRRAVPFGMTIRAFRRTQGAAVDGVERVYGRDEKLEFLRGLDYLVLALPLTDSTRRFLDREAIVALPASATVVNIGRGGLADEEALAEALASGQLAGAVLDTFAVEPLPRESPLWALPNVTVTPHMAGAVYPGEVGEICLRNLLEFAAGRVPAPVVETGRGY